MEIVAFEIERARYGIALRDVQEVLRAVAITRLPRAPRVIEGVIDVRGETLPVFDLRRRFGLRERPVAPDDRLIVARTADRRVALRVDRVLWMRQVDPDAVQDVTQVVPRAEYVTGVARLPGGLVLIHDLRTFLSQAESEELDHALSTADQEGAGG